MKQLKTTLFLLVLWSYSFGCWAVTLEQAKTQGQIGETLSGYLAVIQADPEAAALVQQINEQRRQQYQILAQRNGVSLSEIEHLAGKKLIDHAKQGEWVQGVNQQWRQK
jgi:uncharacterized protein YdbL (DUF1318 family)